MPSPRVEPTRSFNAVAAGQTATLDLPATGIYHGLKLEYGTSTGGGPTQANMEAEVTEIRLIVNGVVQRRMTAQHLFDINSYKGKGVTAGILPIYFEEPWRKTAQGADSLAWGMADVDTFIVEVDVDGAAVSPTLAATALKRPGNRNMGPIVKWRQFTVPVSAIGITNLATLPKQDAYYAFHCLSALIDDVEVQVDQKTILKGVIATLNDVADDYGYVAHADWTHIDFSTTRRVSDALSMASEGEGGGAVKDLQIDFNMNTATSFVMVAEVLGLRD